MECATMVTEIVCLIPLGHEWVFEYKTENLYIVNK